MDFAEMNIINALTVEQSQGLAFYEKAIADEASWFVRVGHALGAIQGEGLFVVYGTFEEYCARRWGFSRIHAWRLIEAAKVVDNLLPIGNVAITAETQARELMRAPESERAAVWREVVESAPINDDGEPVITAKFIRSIVDKDAPPKDKPRKHADKQRPLNDDDRFDDLMAAWITAPESVRQRFMNAINGVSDSDDAVDPICWGEFVAHRKAIRKPLSGMSASKNRNILAGLSLADQRKAVDTTIANNWTGIFPPKVTHGTHIQSRPQSAVERVRAAAAARETSQSDY